ncbi:MAG: TFIIB-type zinc finger domain-containing protein [Methanobrevibacter sp.]|jgi:hypothetical protein|nr:TFIIB-type zinc finger domain-containing protein [Candidatus Methanoflexus mossambicus]
MEKLACEICGSTDIIKEDGLFVCQSCGVKYSIDEVKSLMGTVKIDNSSEIQNLKILADRALENQQYDEGYKYYEKILIAETDNYEAIFNMSLCKFWTSTIGNPNLDGVVSSAKSAIDIAKTKLDAKKLNDFVYIVALKISNCANSLFIQMETNINLSAMTKGNGFYHAWYSMDYTINLLYEFFENGIDKYDELKIKILIYLISWESMQFFKIFATPKSLTIPYHKFLGDYKLKFDELKKMGKNNNE